MRLWFQRGISVCRDSIWHRAPDQNFLAGGSWPWMGSATRKLLPICFMSTYLVTVLLASIGLLVWKGSSSIPTFPGPRPIPILGNALQMPKTRPWLTFAKWAKEYGWFHDWCSYIVMELNCFLWRWLCILACPWPAYSHNTLFSNR